MLASIHSWPATSVTDERKRPPSSSEMIGSRDGLGTDIVRYSNTLQVGGVFAILVILALISFAMDRLLGAFERRALRWQ